jgi:L-alanine-DL-glutamate epimerase-like enolase superfamily enzyme
VRIESIRLSVFERPGNTSLFDLVEAERGAARRWLHRASRRADEEVHVLHVLTDEGVEGICTVGDARYTRMDRRDLEQLRILAVGENPLDRERLQRKLSAATRGMFARPGWFGALDNCLWDIAGKVAGLPVYALIGRARESCPAYYNIGGNSAEALADDAQRAVGIGFPAVKDHLRRSADENIAWAAAVRQAVGADIDVIHDAALADYALQDALRVGRALEELRFLWFEEPLPDAQQATLQALCAALDIPIVAPESMMHNLTLSAQWLLSGATDWLRGNARHGVTATLKLAHLAELHDANIELNGPGGLFGLVHAHLVCCLGNTSYYEYFPNGSRDAAGKEIGLLNPPTPVKGRIAPPDGPGWGAEWDWERFEEQRSATL